MLPANPRGSCGFTVEVGNMAPWLKGWWADRWKLELHQLVAGLGGFRTLHWTSVKKTHTTCLLTFPKIVTVPTKFEKLRTFFSPFLDHGHQYHYMRNIDQQCPKKSNCKHSRHVLPECRMTLCTKKRFQVLLIPYPMVSSLRRSLSCRVPLSWCQTSPWHRWGISTSSCEPVWMLYVGSLFVLRCGLKGHWFGCFGWKGSWEKTKDLNNLVLWLWVAGTVRGQCF